MYGHYAPSEDADTYTATDSFNLDHLIKTTRSIKERNEKPKVTMKPVRLNTGSMKMADMLPVRMKLTDEPSSAMKQYSTDEPYSAVKLYSTAEQYSVPEPTAAPRQKSLDEDLDSSFIEDPEHKMMETPVHKHIQGSFTKDMNDRMAREKIGVQDDKEQDPDSSLVRLLQPLNLNTPALYYKKDPVKASDTVTGPRTATRPQMTVDKPPASPDSGSFTSDTCPTERSSRNARIQLNFAADDLPSSMTNPGSDHPSLSSALKSLGDKSTYAPVRIGARNPSVDYKPVRMRFDTENKENLTGSGGTEKLSIQARLSALSGHGEETHPSLHALSSRAHGSDRPSLRSQPSSRLCSAPTLSSTGSSAPSQPSHPSQTTEERTGPAKERTNHSFIQDILSLTSHTNPTHRSSENPPRTEQYQPYQSNQSLEKGPEQSRQVQTSGDSSRTANHQGSGQVLQTPASKTSAYKQPQVYNETPRQSSLAPARAEIFETPRYTSTTRPAALETPRGSNLAPSKSEVIDTPRYSNPVPTRHEIVDTPRFSKPTPSRTEIDGNYPRYSTQATPDPAPLPTPTPMSRSISLPARDNDRTMPPPSMSISRAKADTFLTVNNRRYKVMKLLGKGGSSRVYEAFDEEKNIVVAIKRVDLSNADEAQAVGYINEINMLMKLQGEDRIVRLYDYEKDDVQDILYVVMEKGDTDLASLLKEYANSKEITLAMIKHYWIEMLNAVTVIHKNGIIHSDLKPANFLLVAGRLKLIDFGIASSVQSDKTSVMKDTQMGTFNFMSPEAIQDLSGPQYDGSGVRKPVIKISYKSDVWSLGCILYHLTYGKMPFGDIKIPVMKLQAILNPEHKIPFPANNVDPLLLDVLKACLNRDVKTRPSIQELLEHPYVTGGEAKPEAAAPASALQMLASLESNLAGVLSPTTFQRTRELLQIEKKKLNM